MRILTTQELELVFGGGGSSQSLAPVVTDGRCTGCTNDTGFDPGWDPGVGGSDPGSDGGDSSPAPPCFAPVPAADTANRSVIENHEGGIVTRPYVPGSTSGVTIGGGVDLHAWMPSDLRGWGISDAEMAPFKPFMATGNNQFGPVGAAATSALAANNFGSISQSLAERLTQGAEKTVLNRVANSFDQNSKISTPFFQLPSAVQTVVLDVAYKFGPNTQNQGTPRFFFEAALRGDFNQAANELNEMAKKDGRFADDAALLSVAISNGQVPSSASSSC